MTSLPSPNMAISVSAEEIFVLLDGYQQALGAHVEWLRRWYQAVLHRGEGKYVIPDAGADVCPFEHWLAAAGKGMFASLASYRELGERHRAVHDKAEQMSQRAVAAQTLTTSDYESLMSLVLAFSTAAQAAEREAWMALAVIDPLTGVGNRQSMMSQLITERDRALRQNHPCCVALCDIDHFKKINDTFGHLQGDNVLRAVAGCLKQVVRPYDIVYRYGGEEFLICLPGASLTVGRRVLERLRETIAALDLRDTMGRAIDVTASFGLASDRCGCGRRGCHQSRRPSALCRQADRPKLRSHLWRAGG
jgi:diguanylate cyclase